MARTEPGIDSGLEVSLCIDLPSPTLKVIFTFSPLASHIWSRMLLATKPVCETRHATSAAINSRALLSD